MTTWFRITARDSLFFRANLNFGGAGEWGSGVMPPAPSVFAGAFRSAILATRPSALEAFVRTGRSGDSLLDTVLGVMPEPGSREGSEPIQPGTFRVAWSSLARFSASSTDAVIPLPRDLVCFEDAEAKPHSPLARIEPVEPSGGIVSSGCLPARALLRSGNSGKPVEGRWLLPAGQKIWLDGKAPTIGNTVATKELFRRDPRLGIGLDGRTGTVSEGLLYTTDGQSLLDDGVWQTGFIVGIDGLGGTADLLGHEGSLRLGGDGRCARYERIDGYLPPAGPAPDQIALDRGFRLVLRSPVIAHGGWLPPLVTARDGGYILEGPGGAFRARLVCASSGRAEVLGGWDLHAWRPKPALRAAAAGSVFWFDQFEGDAGKLVVWVESGMPGDPTESPSRRAEGYGQAFVGCWEVTA